MPPHPNLFIVGAQKAGTTSLYRYLGQHPQIYTSPEKEPRYFDRLHHDDIQHADYLALFEGADDEPIRAEGSTFYLYNPHVPERIHKRVPKAKILASLRDPIQRAYSNYWRQVAGGHELDDFPTAIRREHEAYTTDQDRVGYLDRSLYADAIKRYQDTFGSTNVHVILLHDLKADARETLRTIFRFLDIDPAPAATIDLSRQNTFRGTPYQGPIETLRTHPLIKRIAQALLPRRVRDWLGNDVLLSAQPKPPLPEEIKPLLADFFEPDIQRLETLLDRNLDPLRASYPTPPERSPPG